MDCIHKCHPWRHPWARPPHVTCDRGRKNRQSASSSTAPRNAPNSKSTFRHPSPVTSSVPSGERPGHSTVARPGSSPRHTHLQTLGATASHRTTAAAETTSEACPAHGNSNVSNVPASYSGSMSYAREPRASDPFHTSEPIPAGNGSQSRAPGLPTARAFLTALFDSLRAHPHPHMSQGRGTSASATARPSAANAEDGTSNDASNVLGAAPATSTTGNVLVNAPDAVRKALLTLHVLFPNELLPALDLLDRRLVMRFRVRREEGVRGTGKTRDGAVVGVGDGERDGRHAGRGVGGVLPDDAHEVSVRNTEDARSAGKAQAIGATSASAPESASASMLLSAPNPATSASTSGHNTAHATTTGAGSGFSSSSGPAIGIPDADPDIAQKPPVDSLEDETIHYVRSAQHRPSRYTTSYDSTTSHQVRLRAWNCSCPAFAFSAFPSTFSDPAIPQMQIELRELDTLLWGTGGVSPTPATATQKYAGEDGNGDINGSLGKVIGKSCTSAQSWRFGGESVAEEIGMPPVCKHLLACVLVERCGIFAEFVEERVIGVKEAAGWAAGWGD